LVDIEILIIKTNKQTKKNNFRLTDDYNIKDWYLIKIIIYRFTSIIPVRKNNLTNLKREKNWLPYSCYHNNKSMSWILKWISVANN